MLDAAALVLDCTRVFVLVAGGRQVSDGAASAGEFLVLLKAGQVCGKEITLAATVNGNMMLGSESVRTDILQAVERFARGAGAGPSGLHPDFLRQLVERRGATDITRAKAAFANLLADGEAPNSHRSLCGRRRGPRLREGRETGPSTTVWRRCATGLCRHGMATCCRQCLSAHRERGVA